MLSSNNGYYTTNNTPNVSKYLDSNNDHYTPNTPKNLESIKQRYTKGGLGKFHFSDIDGQLLNRIH